MFLIVAYVINSAFYLTLCHKDYLFCYCLGLCRSQNPLKARRMPLLSGDFLNDADKILCVCLIVLL